MYAVHQIYFLSTYYAIKKYIWTVAKEELGVRVPGAGDAMAGTQGSPHNGTSTPGLPDHSLGFAQEAQCAWCILV